METKLFWISMACGAYALILRKFLKDENRLKSRRGTALMHGLFLALAGVVAGSLAGSYWERPDLSWKLMAGLGAAGFLAGILWRLFRPKTAEMSSVILGEDLEWADTGFSAILLAAIIMYFLVQAFKIPSGSMRNTLLEKDHLFVNKFIYGVRIPLTDKKILRLRPVQRQDVVVFRFPTEDKSSPHYGKDFIKRAIGLPGDVVEIHDKKVFVNGKALEEPYVNFAEDFILPPSRLFKNPAEFQRVWETGGMARVAGESIRDNFGPITVPAGQYLVMGDNRDRSFDSRFWGPMPDTYLKGRAWFVYWPLGRRKIIQ